MVTVHGIPHEDFERVAALLEAHRPVEFDDGHAATTTAAPGDGVDTGDNSPAGAAENDRGTLQLSEESLVVGKRLVNRGGTRIRRYVVETPVEEQVSLHDERVIVDRHPVADGRAVDANAFADNDRVIEMTETTEQAVVGKTARVVERGQPAARGVPTGPRRSTTRFARKRSRSCRSRARRWWTGRPGRCPRSEKGGRRRAEHASDSRAEHASGMTPLNPVEGSRLRNPCVTSWDPRDDCRSAGG